MVDMVPSYGPRVDAVKTMAVGLCRMSCGRTCDKRRPSDHCLWRVYEDMAVAALLSLEREGMTVVVLSHETSLGGS